MSRYLLLFVFISFYFSDTILLDKEKYPFLRKRSIENVKIINITEKEIHYQKSFGIFGIQSKKINLDYAILIIDNNGSTEKWNYFLENNTVKNQNVDLENNKVKNKNVDLILLNDSTLIHGKIISSKNKYISINPKGFKYRSVIAQSKIFKIIKEQELFSLDSHYKQNYYKKYRKSRFLGVGLQLLPHPLMSFGLGYLYIDRFDLMLSHNLIQYGLPILYFTILHESIKQNDKYVKCKVDGNNLSDGVTYETRLIKNYNYSDFLIPEIIIPFLPISYIFIHINSYFQITQLINTHNDLLYESLFPAKKFSYLLLPTSDGAYLNLSYKF